MSLSPFIAELLEPRNPGWWLYEAMMAPSVAVGSPGAMQCYSILRWERVDLEISKGIKAKLIRLVGAMADCHTIKGSVTISRDPWKNHWNHQHQLPYPSEGQHRWDSLIWLLNRPTLSWKCLELNFICCLPNHNQHNQHKCRSPGVPRVAGEICSAKAFDKFLFQLKEQSLACGSSAGRIEKITLSNLEWIPSSFWTGYLN